MMETNSCGHILDMFVQQTIAKDDSNPWLFILNYTGNPKVYEHIKCQAEFLINMFVFFVFFKAHISISAIKTWRLREEQIYFYAIW